MRAWTLVAAGLVAASVGVSGAVLPDGQAATGRQEQRKAPAAGERGGEEGVVRDVQRQLQVLGGPDVQIGIAVRDVDADQARGKSGAVVSHVRDDSPAATAGFKEGDVIVEFDGERVRSARHVSRLVGETPAGRPVTAVVEREGRRVELRVTPEAAGGSDFPMHGLPNRQFEFNAPNFRFDDPDIGRLFQYRSPGDPDVLVLPRGRGRLGIGIQDLSPQLAEYFGTKDGVLVTTVEPESPAAKAGLKAGDVITAIGDTEVRSPSDLTRAVRQASEGSDLSITYMRDKKKAAATAKLQRRERERERVRTGEPI